MFRVWEEGGDGESIALDAGGGGGGAPAAGEKRHFPGVPVPGGGPTGWRTPPRAPSVG